MFHHTTLGLHTFVLHTFITPHSALTFNPFIAAFVCVILQPFFLEFVAGFVGALLTRC